MNKALLINAARLGPHTVQGKCPPLSREVGQSVEDRRASALQSLCQYFALGRKRSESDAPFSFPPATRARSGCWRMVNSKSELVLFNMVSAKPWINFVRVDAIPIGKGGEYN